MITTETINPCGLLISDECKSLVKSRPDRRYPEPESSLLGTLEGKPR